MHEGAAEDGAENFKKELEDEINALEIKGDPCSPDELCRIQMGERRLENLKQKPNWRLLVACAKYELQIVSESTRRRKTQT